MGSRMGNQEWTIKNGQSRMGSIMGNQEWTIQRNWQQWVQDEDKQSKKHNTEN
jgi:HKD family nuclease